MKKQILLFSIALLFVTASKAQIAKKDILLGATVAVNSSDNSIHSTNSNSNLRTRVGYAIGRNSVLNLAFGYSSDKGKGADGNIFYRNKIFSTGLSWQKFFVIKDKLGWYTDLYGMYNNGTTKHTYPGSEYKTRSKGYSAGVNPGIYYRPVDGLLLSVSAGGINYEYYQTSTSGQPIAKGSNFTVNVFDYFGFGIGFIINKKSS